MSEDDESAPRRDGHLPDPRRRRLLTRAVAGVGAAGVIAAAVPFVDAWEPSARALAGGAPVRVDVSGLQKGEMLTYRWRRKPVWVLRRTEQQLATLPELNGELRDPESQAPQQPPGLPHWDPVQRSIKPEYLVLVGICTHLGCVPDYRRSGQSAGLGPDWRGGFFCPCHGSRYDLAGRVFAGVPAPLNLPVPPHYYESENVIRTGVLADGSLKNWSPDTW